MFGVGVMCERWLTLGGRGRRVWGIRRDFDVMMDIYKRDHKKVHITFGCVHKGGGGGVRMYRNGLASERCGEGPHFFGTAA